MTDADIDRAISGRPTVPTEVLIHLKGRLHRVAYKRGQTILEAARAAGLAPVSACEAGFCAACAARCIRGRIELANNQVYSKSELADGLILTCQAHAFGDTVEITYDAF